MTDKTFYATTPIYYVNGSPHFAHSYTSVATDAITRFHRLDGRAVRFVTGTDEHGQKVEQAARAAGVQPAAFCDQVSDEFRAMGRLMNIAIDDFIRTTEPRHERACRALWTELEKRGQIYLGEFAGHYSVRDEAFYDEMELIDGKAPTGAPVEWISEPNYFFRLSAWQERLLEYYDENPGFIQPVARRNEVISFVKGGLRDLSISRSSLSWGIRVPGDDDHVMYVWLDALTNYITAAGYPETESELWKRSWPADLHVVGKDILRFHCVYWPAFLLAAGLEPPRTVFAHGWWTVEGQKMSKSLNNFIPPAELVDRYGLDPVRYFMLRELAFGNDGDLSSAALVNRINADLANGLGNLFHRTLTLVARKCGSCVPEPGQFAEEDMLLLRGAADLLANVRANLEAFALHRALEAVWKVIAEANRYIDEAAPWALPDNDERVRTVLYVVAETLRGIAVVIQPFMPDSAAALLDQLSIAPEARDFRSFAQPLTPGTNLPSPQIVFRRFEQMAPRERRAMDA